MESEQRACSSKKLGGLNEWKTTDEAQVRDELKEGAHAEVGSGSSYGLRTAERDLKHSCTEILSP